MTIVHFISTMVNSPLGPLGPRVQLAGDALFDTSTSPTDSEVGYTLTSGGAERSYEGTGQPFVTIDDWLIEGAVGDYECSVC